MNTFRKILLFSGCWLLSFPLAGIVYAIWYSVTINIPNDGFNYCGYYQASFTSSVTSSLLFLTFLITAILFYIKRKHTNISFIPKLLLITLLLFSLPSFKNKIYLSCDSEDSRVELFPEITPYGIGVIDVFYGQECYYSPMGRKFDRTKIHLLSINEIKKNHKAQLICIICETLVLILALSRFYKSEK